MWFTPSIRALRIPIGSPLTFSTVCPLPLPCTPVTISAVPSVPTTSVDYYGLNNALKRDADPVAPGFQLAVGPGRSVLLLRTESASRHYQYSTIIVHRPENACLRCA